MLAGKRIRVDGEQRVLRTNDQQQWSGRELLAGLEEVVVGQVARRQGSKATTGVDLAHPLILREKAGQQRVWLAGMAKQEYAVAHDVGGPADRLARIEAAGAVPY